MRSSSTFGQNADPLQQLLRGCRRVPGALASQQTDAAQLAAAGSSPKTSTPTPDVPDAKGLPAELDFFSNRAATASSSKQTAAASSKPQSVAEPADATDPQTDNAREGGPDHVFRDLVPHPSLHIALARMRLQSPTPVQRRAIAAMRAGSDVVAIAPTGSGKTLAYALPLILDHIKTVEADGEHKKKKKSGAKCTPGALVLAPTRELAHQIARVFRRVAETSRSTLRVVELSSRAAFAGLSGGEAVADIVVGTPMRVALAADAGALRLSEVRHVVLDEADELFSDKFLAQLDAVLAAAGARQRRVKKAGERGGRKRASDADDEEEDKDSEDGDEKHDDGKSNAGEEDADDSEDEEGSSGPRVHMFSATLPAETDEIARRLLPKMKRVTVSAGDFGGAAAVDQVATAISQRFIFVGGRGEQGKVLAIRDLLREGGVKPPALLFVQSKERAAELFRELVYDGIAVDAIHGDRTATARAAAVARFRAGKVWLLIATDIVARGLDFLAVNSVVNYDVPASASAYVHRIGRTGRNGRAGNAVTLFTEEDVKVIGPVVKVAKASGAEVPDWLMRVASRVRADETKRLQTRPPKRRRVGGPNRASLKGRKRKRRQGDDEDKGDGAAAGGGGEE